MSRLAGASHECRSCTSPHRTAPIPVKRLDMTPLNLPNSCSDVQNGYRAVAETPTPAPSNLQVVVEAHGRVALKSFPLLAAGHKREAARLRGGQGYMSALQGPRVSACADASNLHVCI